MNPKDMTNSDLLVELVNRTKGYGFLNDPKPVISELLRRLGEADALRNNESQILAERDGAVFIASNIAAKADALRKENEGLRKDKARLDLIESLGGHLLAVSCDIVIDCLASRAREKIDELLRSNEKSILINEQAS